jgi:ubiquinone/menaquinone biosynthesis C-methylase UbiE
MKIIPQKLIDKNINWKIELLQPYLKDTKTLLDFGCGDLSLAKALQKKNKALQITGVDVVKFPNKVSGITFRSYDGNVLPFRNNSFDTVIAFYVFHHCDSAQVSFDECFRVARKRVIFIEPVMRYSFENYLMGAADWVFNIWKEKSIPFTNQFMTLNNWKKIMKKQGKYSTKPLKNFLSIPIGKAYLFEAIKK